MARKKVGFGVLYFIGIIAIVLTGIFGVAFSSLSVSAFSGGFYTRNSEIITAILGGVITTLTVISIVTLTGNFKIIGRISIALSLLICFSSIILYILKIGGVLDKITSVQGLRDFVASGGKLAAIYFVLIQFLQVVILPVPSFITLAVGVLLFGAFYGALLSILGIVVGSIVAFYIGRIWGYKAVKRIVGEKALEKGLKLTQGKDKIIFTLMFLLPCFPDDLLCFIAGLTKIDAKFFIVMVTVTRTVAVFSAAYSLNNNLIPYNTWWGILLWILFFIIVFATFILICKKPIKNETYNQ